MVLSTSRRLLLPPVLLCFAAAYPSGFSGSESVSLRHEQNNPPGSVLIPVRRYINEYRVSNIKISMRCLWSVNLIIGGQATNMMLDTGSSDLWVLGPDLPENFTHGLGVYNPRNSPEAQLMANENFKVSYGSGNIHVAGPVYNDTVSIGGATVPQVPFGLATSASFPEGQWGSGLMGLGFRITNSIYPTAQPTIMEILQPSLYQPVMTINFKTDDTGEFGLGFVDENKFDGPLTTVKIGDQSTPPSSWTAHNATYIVSGRDLGTLHVMFDTGGPGTTGPEAAVHQYYSAIKGARDASNGNATDWSVPCDTKMPDLTLRFAENKAAEDGGEEEKHEPNVTELVIPGWSFVEENKNDPHGLCGSTFTATNGDVASAGYAFFTTHYVVFNQRQGTVSWARRKALHQRHSKSTLTYEVLVPLTPGSS